MKAVKCPVCGGSGKLIVPDNPIYEQRHGCAPFGGLGWILVPDDTVHIYSPQTVPVILPESKTFVGNYPVTYIYGG